ncbi:PTPS-domain-containing protein [Neoconidiobolus thromboides FSU 785]|nr:PTPS-domain-containing protein [Neoconidiobolus thromboides FSU 785]
MAIGYITRVEKFSSAHRLHATSLSDSENQAIYGKCNHINCHGHNYTIEATIRGEIDHITGMIINISDLKQWMKDLIIEPLDHKNIDKDVEYFFDKPSTAENLAVFAWEALNEKLLPFAPKAKLFEIKIHETDRNTASYRGE